MVKKLKPPDLILWRKWTRQRKTAESFRNWTMAGEVWLVWPTLSDAFLFCSFSPGVPGIYPAMFGTHVFLFDNVYTFLFMY